MADDETYKIDLYLNDDDAPRIGGGYRLVTVKETERWAYLEAVGDRYKQRVPMDRWDKIMERNGH
jgi:hypothetical protein